MFKYKLIGDNDYVFDIVGTLSKNRGIDDLTEYLNLDESVTTHWSEYKNIDNAVELLVKHIENNSNILIIPDQDADGYTSATIMYEILKLHNNSLNITYHIHDKKVHGINGIEISDNIDLLIVPDASTNEIDEHKRIKNKGIDILVIDHHDIEFDNYNNEYAVVVNPQQDKNGNLNLSGAGIVYKVCKALDDYYNTDYADYFLDLVAVGCIADVMSMKDKEVRYYVNKGLQNINNEFLRALIEKQSYSMKNEINPTTIGYYISPLINSVTRIGTLEDRTDMFKAFIGHKKLVEYKQKNGEIIQIPFFDDMARRCINIKNKQNRIKEKSVELVLKNIKINENDKVLIVKDVDIEEGTSGLIANTLATKFMKPTIVFGKNKNGKLKGSARSCVSFNRFKDVIINTNLFELVAGHDSAFGVEIKEDNISELIHKLNDLLENEVFEIIYNVDFIIPIQSMSKTIIKEIVDLKDVWGKDIDEPLIIVNSIPTKELEFKVIGKNKDTIKFEYNDITYIGFKQDENKLMELTKSQEIELLCKASLNEYNGNTTYQMIFSEFNTF